MYGQQIKLIFINLTDFHSFSFHSKTVKQGHERDSMQRVDWRSYFLILYIFNTFLSEIIPTVTIIKSLSSWYKV